MDLELSGEQQELRDEFRRQLAAHCDHDVRRAAMEQPGAVDRKLWRRLADAGLFALTVSEDGGGLGAGLAEAVIVHEEIGRAAVPGPVVSTSLLATHLPGAVEGSVVVTAAFAADPLRVVEHLDGSDVVAIMSPEKVTTIPAELLAGEPLTPLDPLSPVHRGRGDAWPEGTLVASGPAAARVWRVGTLLCAATSVGLGAAAVEMATSYAQQREQFGRPIGGFQAVKHLLANALAETEVARTAVHAAAVTGDEANSSDEASTEDELWKAVACARVLASRAAQTSTRACIQVHGGMGFTWDIDAHLYLKRALVLDTHFETPDSCRNRLAATL